MAPVGPAPRILAVDELLTYLRVRFGNSVQLAHAPERAQGGMDTEVYFLSLRGGRLDDAWTHPLVLRVHRATDRTPVARREAEAQAWCVDHEYPAPPVLFVGTAAEGFTTPVQIMPRVSGTTMLAAITSRPWRLRRELQRLAALHARLHALDPSTWPNQTVTFAQNRLDPVRWWATELNDPEISAALERALPIARALDTGPAVVCHGDFHPLNVIVRGEAATVLDWTDAGLGDAMGDVARTALLLRVAGIATAEPALRSALRAAAPAFSWTYLSAYRQIAPFDAARFRRWTTLHLLHGWAQVCALHAGLVGSASERAQIPKGLAPWLERRHHRAAAHLP